jgi:hypothetical protein
MSTLTGLCRLDECVDERLAHDFAGHDVLTVRQMGWKGKQNGELQALAERHFEAFATTDRNLSFQQNPARFSIAVVVLAAPTHRLSDLRPIVPALLKALPLLKKGEVREIARGGHLRGASGAGDAGVCPLRPKCAQKGLVYTRHAASARGLAGVPHRPLAGRTPI